MALNSYVFIEKLNMPVTTRAKLLGHSPDTNLKHYTFARSDAELGDLQNLLNSLNQEPEIHPVPDSSDRYPKIIAFPEKAKNLEKC